MRFSNLLSSAILLGASIVSASDVISLTAEDFDSVVNPEQLILVEFFAPWCGHCKALAPHYEEASTSLKAKGIKLAKVDCVDNADLCNSKGVTGYPTLKVYRNGTPTDYGGPRKADGIISYMVKQSLPAVSEVSSAEHEDFIKADKVVIVAYGTSSTSAPASVFSAVAEQHRDDYLFGLTTDAEAAKAAGVTPPAIVLYKQFDEGRVNFPSQGVEDTTADVLNKFIADNSVPLLDEVSGENYQSYSDAGIPLAYLFIENSREDKDTYLEAIKPIAKQHRGKINFVWIDTEKFAEHGRSLNLKVGEWPAFVIHDMKANLKYPLDQSQTPSFALVDDFVTKFATGKLEPTLKSEPIPESQDEPVTVVVQKQFDEIVMDTKKDVFIEFYAPWCGHCKRLKPVWDTLGERFSNIKDKIVIAKMDATENDLPPNSPFKIAGFPTIKFRAAGSTEFIDYSGDRSIEDLVKFVEENAANDLTIPETEATPDAQQHIPDEL